MKILSLAIGLIFISTALHSAPKRDRDFNGSMSTTDHRAAAHHFNQLAQSHFREYQRNKKRARHHVKLALEAERAKQQAEPQESKTAESNKA